MAEAKRMLREADANGDGRISRTEFCALLQENVAPDSLSLYDARLRLHHSAPAPAA
jgi:calcium-dependent protein kinase